MIKWIKSLFCSKNEELVKEIEILKAKLSEKQEVINQTNAYWKKKLHAAKAGKKKKDSEV